MTQSQEKPRRALRADIQSTTWFNQPALMLENDVIRVIVVPEMGAKIVSLFDKRTQLEWLVGPGDRPFKPASYGSVFTDQDMSGWDEMFPTITACTYPGTEKEIQLPDHGEIWSLPWQQIENSEGKLAFAAEGRALPYRFSREIELIDSSILKFTYHAINLSETTINVMWAAHPQFNADLQTRIVLPPHINEVLNVLPESFGWGPPGTIIRWPDPQNQDGSNIRPDTVGSPDQKQARKFYIQPDTEASWMRIKRKTDNCWLTISWDPEEIPYFGLWIDEGYLNPESIIAPEPSTGFYDSLELAVRNGRHMTIEPDKTVSWSLEMQLGNQHDLFPTPFNTNP